MKLGGRVNEASAKKILAKQLGEFANHVDSVGFLDCKTGRISGKMLVSKRFHFRFLVPMDGNHAGTCKESQEARHPREAGGKGPQSLRHQEPCINDNLWRMACH